MKKLTFTTALFFIVCFFSYCQDSKVYTLEKGTSLIGTYFYGGYSIDEGMIGSTGLRYSYFLSDNLSLGFDSRMTMNGKRYREVNFGPFLRYYLSNNRVKPFLETRYGVGLSEINIEGQNNISDRISNSFVGGGLLFMNKKNRLGIELSAGYEFDFSNSSNSRFRSGVGINIKL